MRIRKALTRWWRWCEEAKLDHRDSWVQCQKRTDHPTNICASPTHAPWPGTAQTSCVRTLLPLWRLWPLSSHLLNESIKALEKRQKQIKVADSSEFGWTTGQHYDSNPLAENTQDEKHLEKAEKDAE